LQVATTAAAHYRIAFGAGQRVNPFQAIESPVKLLAQLHTPAQSGQGNFRRQRQ
jgi:hypothetical protein